MKTLVSSILLFMSYGTAECKAQTVEPVIVEYKTVADGKIMLTNNTLKPIVVILEPRSFGISIDGNGIFRQLDPGIKVELSRTSVKLEPKQSYYVFYKAASETLPAWFTIYSAFSQVEHGSGIDVRILLPHTVYLYQKEPIAERDVRITDAVFSPKSKKIVCLIENGGDALARIQDVEANGGRASEKASGFPLLPEGKRRVELDWPEATPPNEVSFRFEHFTVKHSISTEDR